MDYSQKLREFVESNLIIDDSEAQFTDSDNFFALGFVNSLFAMKLVNFIEQNFNIKVENDDLDINNFSSIENILKFINRK